ncbi:hypothetical protein [Burkholderia territorii]|uniref:hypothetical protein n=1 Tax=Burkholderia territorii TaxID=1503055 RepID=UPI0012DB4E87|nr:hypothetical protein [Burkholderia territorii]
MSLISTAAASISLAKEIGKAAMGLRDFNAMAAKISDMNAALLTAQDSLFQHNAQLLTLQQELFQLRLELDAANAALSEKGRYELFEVSKGAFVYKSKGESPDEPTHYVCQPCFDTERQKVVLKFHPEFQFHVASWNCPRCKNNWRAR